MLDAKLLNETKCLLYTMSKLTAIQYSKEDQNRFLAMHDNIAEVFALLTERGHAKWICIWDQDDPNISSCGRCSICNRVSARPLGHFCRWCGAIMDEE